MFDVQKYGPWALIIGGSGCVNRCIITNLSSPLVLT